LVYMHTKEINNILYSISLMWSYINSHTLSEDDKSIAKRFLKASYDRIPVDNQIDNITCFNSSIGHCRMFPPNYEMFEDILDNKPVYFGYDTMTFMSNNCYKSIENLVKSEKPKNIILSLSMGVDSAICSIILSELRKTYNFNLYAVHINYCNRDTNIQEELFIESWCDFINLKCYVRRISEIKREPCMNLNLRDTYESYTKNVRMNTYKNVWKNILKLESDPVVVLGHNKNDCFENILTNITQQKKYDNLLGMKIVDEQDDITFWRPLLGNTKDIIKAFAKNFHIPHLMNSTPSWSARGKIRDIVRPTLDRWDPRCIESFYKLSEVVSSLNSVLDESVNMFLNCVTEKQQGLYNIDGVSSLPLTEVFWTQFFIKLFKGKMNISHKSIKSFVERINQNLSHNFYAILSKEISITITTDGNKRYNIAVKMVHE